MSKLFIFVCLRIFVITYVFMFCSLLCWIMYVRWIFLVHGVSCCIRSISRRVGFHLAWGWFSYLVGFEGSSFSGFSVFPFLVVAVVVGSLLGFILDSWFDTRPWLTISFFFMGVAAGILNVIRSAKKTKTNYCRG